MGDSSDQSDMDEDMSDPPKLPQDHADNGENDIDASVVARYLNYYVEHPRKGLKRFYPKPNGSDAEIFTESSPHVVKATEFVNNIRQYITSNEVLVAMSVLVLYDIVLLIGTLVIPSLIAGSSSR